MEQGSPKSLSEFRKQHIEGVLGMTHGDVEKAARMLDIPVEKLRVLMRKLKIAYSAEVPKRESGMETPGETEKITIIPKPMVWRRVDDNQPSKETES